MKRPTPRVRTSRFPSRIAGTEPGESTGPQRPTPSTGPQRPTPSTGPQRPTQSCASWEGPTGLLPNTHPEQPPRLRVPELQAPQQAAPQQEAPHQEAPHQEAPHQEAPHQEAPDTNLPRSWHRTARPRQQASNSEHQTENETLPPRMLRVGGKEC